MNRDRMLVGYLGESSPLLQFPAMDRDICEILSNVKTVELILGDLLEGVQGRDRLSSSRRLSTLPYSLPKRGRMVVSAGLGRGWSSYEKREEHFRRITANFRTERRVSKFGQLRIDSY